MCLKNFYSFLIIQILTSVCTHFKGWFWSWDLYTNKWICLNNSKRVSRRARGNSQKVYVFMCACHTAEFAGHTTVVAAIKASSATCKWSHCLDPKWRDLSRLIVLSWTACMTGRSSTESQKLKNDWKSILNTTVDSVYGIPRVNKSIVFNGYIN